MKIRTRTASSKVVPVAAALIGAVLLGSALALAADPPKPAQQSAAAAATAPQIKTEPVLPTPVAADLEAGKKLYLRHCAQCHGVEGKGDGPAAEFVYPRPRDFTLAIYKVRSTPSGQLPTDHDLFKVISDGLPGTSMPPWRKVLSDGERWQLVHFVKTLDILELFKEEAPKTKVAIGKAPRITTELIAKGERLYEEKKCGQCHGKFGRGDGESSDTLKDEWGHAILPVNFSKSWRFRGGDSVEDIFRTFTTGFNGTPMPSFIDAMPSMDERWALAAYVKSLARPQRTGQVLRARFLAGTIPADPHAPEWERAEFVDFPLAGQIIVEPRRFTPIHDVITARALYNEQEIAILLEWDDGTQNRGGAKPPDQVGLQFPVRLSPDSRPYLVLGDEHNPVDTWRWNGRDGLQRFTAHGPGRIQARDSGSLVAEGGYRDGQYRIILRRPLDTGKDDEVQFAPGGFVPVAFHLWDGDQGEEGLKMALSSWYQVLLQPSTPLAAYLWPVVFGFGAVGAQFWIVRRTRRSAAKA